MEKNVNSLELVAAKSPSQDIPNKFSITCSNVPENLFNEKEAKSHFAKFGKVLKIFLQPKKELCIIDYETYESAEKALLNAGAYDGFMFDVTWTKRKRKKTKKEQDPDWVPDSDVEDELKAMGGAGLPKSRLPRQQAMQVDKPQSSSSTRKTVRPRQVPAPTVAKPIKRPIPVYHPSITQAHIRHEADTQPPVPPSVSVSTLSTELAASELRSLRTRAARTPDEQRRILDIRDRTLRAWGGTGARVQGATIGTCPDMCPEKERLAREAEHQVALYESSSMGGMSAKLAVKQYSRSSADQEAPMCYELRPARTLARTMAHIVCHVAQLCDEPQTSLADWFHFMWDRCRGIRKDITQQALCCAESVHLIEQCARFHAHCAARLADCDDAAFDQRLNTDNLTKCLQTLKHMYADLGARGQLAAKPHEPEFRGYIALLNLGDGNFMWEVQQLSPEIQRSPEIRFALAVFSALDNNNFVRFFRLVREHASYLQACILLRYFNDVRARALARTVKAFAPRGGARFPASHMLQQLAFQDLESLNLFVTHYGLRFTKHDGEVSVILDRNKFIDDSDPYPVSRSIDLIESKRTCSVGEVICGGELPIEEDSITHSSFDGNGYIKDSALLAEDQNYKPECIGELSKLHEEIETPGWEQRISALSHNAASNINAAKAEHMFAKPNNVKIHIAKTTPKLFEDNIKLFNIPPSNSFTSEAQSENPPDLNTKVFQNQKSKKIYISKSEPINAFAKPTVSKQPSNESVFSKPATTTIFTGSSSSSNNFVKPAIPENRLFNTNTQVQSNTNVFGNPFTVKSDDFQTPVAFTTNVFARPSEKSHSTFTEPAHDIFEIPQSVFGSTQKNNVFLQTGDLNILSRLGPPKSEEAEVKSDGFDPPNAGGNVFETVNSATSFFPKPDLQVSKPVFGNVSSGELSSSIFGKTDQNCNIFSKPTSSTADIFNKPHENIFNEHATSSNENIFSKAAASSDNIFNQVTSPSATSFSKDGTTENIFSRASMENILNKAESPHSLFSRAVKQTETHMSRGDMFPKSETSSNIFQTAQLSGVSDMFGPAKVADPPPFPTPFSFNQQLTNVDNQLQEQQRQLEEDRRRKEIIQDQQRKDKMRQREEEIERERKQAELERKLEEEKHQAELQRQKELRIAKEKAEAQKRAEEERKRQSLIQEIGNESSTVSQELTDEIIMETLNEIMEDELETYRQMLDFAKSVCEEAISDLCKEACSTEIKCETVRRRRLMRKWGSVWRIAAARSVARRHALTHTPIWMPQNTPEQEASLLRHQFMEQTLQDYRALHRGHKLDCRRQSQLPIKPINIFEVVHDSLFKRLSRVKAYSENIFWKITVSVPPPGKSLKLFDANDWVIRAFTNGVVAEAYKNNILYLKEHIWKNNIKCIFSVSKFQSDPGDKIVMRGSNGLIVYAAEDTVEKLLSRLRQHIETKTYHHPIPVALIIPKYDDTLISLLQEEMKQYHIQNKILDYRLYTCDTSPSDVTMRNPTVAALRWLAKKMPRKPPLEVNTLDNFLNHCVGTELWYRFTLERTTSIGELFENTQSIASLYNAAIEKTKSLVTNEKIYTYPFFPEEFHSFLKSDSVFPKSFEYCPHNWKNCNRKTLEILDSLHLRAGGNLLESQSLEELEENVKLFCENLNWFDDCRELSLKIFQIFPNEIANPNLDIVDFCNTLQSINILDIYDVVIREKICQLCNISEKKSRDLIVYDKNDYQSYRTNHWWYEMEMVTSLQPKIPEDYLLRARASESQLSLSLDTDMSDTYGSSPKRVKYEEFNNSDVTMVEERLQTADDSITKLKSFNVTYSELEECLNTSAARAAEFEKQLRAALEEG